MKIADVSTVTVRVTVPDQALAEAARTMREFSVGALVVVEANDEQQRRPVGMLTDRDIIRGQLLKAADLHCLVVRDVMSPCPLVLSADTELFEAIEALNARGVRRAPIVNAAGSLAGVISLDDLVPVVANELLSLANLLDLRPSLRGGRSAQRLAP
jgi:CBS domain-containing protein